MSIVISEWKMPSLCKTIDPQSQYVNTNLSQKLSWDRRNRKFKRWQPWTKLINVGSFILHIFFFYNNDLTKTK